MSRSRARAVLVVVLAVVLPLALRLRPWPAVPAVRRLPVRRAAAAGDGAGDGTLRADGPQVDLLPGSPRPR
ncbi:hypothetical protein ACFFHJ_24770 [Planotetraspora thailandica]|uniref:hypothetical protein n=1 Tax=Planotetraspora thailandica TaxID=487172 RepID=UPI00194F152C|nr:hypothetical protein [Planotetraspora thailandica]